MVKQKASDILDKFSKEMLHRLIQKMFTDGILNENDLDFTYFDGDVINIIIPTVNYRTKKTVQIIDKLDVYITIELFKKINEEEYKSKIEGH